MLPAQNCLDYNPYSRVGEVAVVRVEKQRSFGKNHCLVYYNKGYCSVLLTHISVRFPGHLHS